jgi:hypothetical protein
VTVQWRLDLADSPAPAEALWELLGEESRQAAEALLAALIAQREQVQVIDEDLGISGSGLSDRSGFARLAAEVALGHAGLVLGLEVSRLARNNVDWYRLLDLCGVTDTVIGDADGLYHPGSFNDRLLGPQGHDERGRAARAESAP